MRILFITIWAGINQLVFEANIFAGFVLET